MLYQYLFEKYKPNQPIFMSDISLPNVKENSLRQMFKTLCDSGKLKRYDTGIYYIPATSRLCGGQTLAPSTVAQYKYVERNGLVEGYCSGFTFANQLGLTTQVPYTMEIVSNNAGAKYREVSMQGLRIILRKPRTTVNSENCTILQFLDLLKDIDKYSDEQPSKANRIIADYMRRAGITKEKIEPYLQLYPDKLFRSSYEMGFTEFSAVINKTFTIIAGLNGSGKSSLTGSIKYERKDLGEIVDGDKLTKECGGDFYVAGQKAMATMEHCLQQCLNFTQEATLSGAYTRRIAKTAKHAGYMVRMYYVGVDSEEESLRRIKNRVEKGGHDIPAEVVHRRWQNRISALQKVLPYCDEVVFFDNENGFVEVGQMRSGIYVPSISETPAWLKAML